MHEPCPDARPRPDNSPAAPPLTAPPAPADYGCVCTLTTHGRTVVRLVGEIDLATSSLITTHLIQVTAGARPSVVVDLRAVTFIDAAGLDPLARARDRALRRGGELALICTDPRILRTLRLAGLLPVFPLVPPSAAASMPVPAPVPRTGRRSDA
ncbi:STAS domain-containing protein [Streptacidiphilus sp. PB12-B1b]|nr:STAS domain-containing protein [Streptacidiphilus sp. PB12-B1b]